MKKFKLDDRMPLLVNEEGVVFTPDGEEIELIIEYVPCRDEGPDAWADRYTIPSNSWYFEPRIGWKYTATDVKGYADDQLLRVVITSDGECYRVTKIVSCDY